jgi:hypothetical protein
VAQWGVIVRALAIVGATSTAARAGTVTLSNGVSGDGAVRITTDDFGSWGFQLSQSQTDAFSPPGVNNAFTPTFLAGPMLFVSTPGNAAGAMVLTEHRNWHNLVERPPQPDGIEGPLLRLVTSSITATGNEAASSFRVADTAGQGIALDFALVQRLTADPAAPSSKLDQIYTLTNHGSALTEVVFHVAWEADLYYFNDNSFEDDIVGTGPGRCGVYMHDRDPRWSVALGAGPLSTVLIAHYYGGKKGTVPGAGPAFEALNADLAKQWIWIERGMPEAWRDYVVGPGYAAVGENDPSVSGDATLGIEFRFAIAAGATETIHVRRYYGTIDIPCFGGANCGNGVLDPGEQCDELEDTPACNAATCTAALCGDGYLNTAAGEACDDGGDSPDCNADCSPARCGDGYVNAAAGEACDSGGEDTATCNGATCTVAACGDGYVNLAAGEECESGALCDVAICVYTFSLGGGCVGCGAGGRGGWVPTVLIVVMAVGGRRRRATC